MDDRIEVEREETKENIVKELQTVKIKIGGCEGQHDQNVHQQNNEKIDHETKECKICLQSSKDSPQPFIQPCHCTGSLKHVHEDCFQEWMKRVIIKKSQAQNAQSKPIECEVCKMRYKVKSNSDKICISWERFKLKAQKKSCQFAFLLSLIVGSMIMLSVACAIMPHDTFSVVFGGNTDSSQQNGGFLQQPWQKAILIVCFCILIITFAFSLCMFIKEFCFTYEIQFKYKGKHLKTMKFILQSWQQTIHQRQ